VKITVGSGVFGRLRDSEFTTLDLETKRMLYMCSIAIWC